MDTILINITCENYLALKEMDSMGIQLLQNSLRVKNGKIHIRAIIEKSLLNDAKTIAKVEVVGLMKDIAKEKQALVNKGNRYR